MDEIRSHLIQLQAYLLQFLHCTFELALLSITVGKECTDFSQFRQYASVF